MASPAIGLLVEEGAAGLVDAGVVIAPPDVTEIVQMEERVVLLMPVPKEASEEREVLAVKAEIG